MGISKAGKENGMIQFAAGRPELPNLLKTDVKRSEYKDTTKYLNALTERSLAVPLRLSSQSCIDEVFRSMTLVQHMPIELIKELASTQNRNCEQMVMQLLQESMERYSLAQPYGADMHDLPFVRPLGSSYSTSQRKHL